jgi:hypothetical protein
MKKGAMFGLDARIALAIFGALSVISGAALYSAIQDAEAMAVLTELEEIGKAWEAYYLDTGETLDFANNTTPASAGFVRGKIHDLINNPGLNGWAGPYLSYPIRPDDLSDNSLVHPKYDYVYIMHLTNASDWGDSTTLASAYCNDAADECSIWAYISGMDEAPAGIHDLIDQKVDGGDGSTAGKFRWSNSGGNVILKVAPLKPRV